MSFIKNPKTIIDLTDSKKIDENIKRLERDEELIIKRVGKYDREIAGIDRQSAAISKDIQRTIKQLIKKKPETIAFKNLMKKKKELRTKQHNLRFKEEAKLRKKQLNLVEYYDDLVQMIKLLKKKKKLLKSHSEKVHKTIKDIKKHLN